MLIARDQVLDRDVGLHGTLFGGDMMARMDKVAGITAALMSRNRRFVTLKVSELIFHSPVRPGEMIEFYGTISRQGRTSLAIQIEVQVYAPVTDVRRDVTSGEFVMVAVGGDGKPEPILWKPEAVEEANRAHELRKQRQASQGTPG
jgi:acyl-CoA thioesterase YciA